MSNYYSVLGLASPSNQVEIKKAYRLLAKKYHPDVNSSLEAESKFKEINEAYEIIGNPTKKKQYDITTSFSLSGINSRSSVDVQSMFSEYGFRQEKKPRHKKTFTQELKKSIKLTFEEAICGIEDKQLDITYKSECNKCNGYGGTIEECKICSGKGLVTSIDGFLHINVTCKACEGKGTTITTPCATCESKGYVEKHSTISINIPAGITPKSTMVSRGNGNKINQKKGDLYISIEIEPSDDYRRENNDIIKTISVSVIDILQENTISVSGFNRDYDLDMKNAFQGKNFIFPMEGIKSLSSERVGDFIVEVNLVFPELTPEQKELISKF